MNGLDFLKNGFTLDLINFLQFVEFRLICIVYKKPDEKINEKCIFFTNY